MNTVQPPVTTTRVWDLRPGDVFRGRTIVLIHGVVGLASSPVAVLDFGSADEREHPVQIRVAAAHSEACQHYDEIMRRAQTWVRCCGLREGEALDLDRLRSDVMSGVGAALPSAAGTGAGGYR